jgi:transglutaminase-like putative cysteine protease
MRIHVTHRTVYRYDRPTTGVIQVLRLTPRNHDGQYVVRWAMDVSDDCHLDQHEDAFGNITHTFTADGPFTELRVSVEGEIETQDTQGIIAGAVERLPPNLYLRETPLTQSNPSIAEFAIAAKKAAGDDVLKLLHTMIARLHQEMVYDTSPTESTTTAAESFALKRGVCQDFTHIFIAASRSLGIPARYIGGYFHRADGVVDQEAGHAWAEAFVPELGWVAFDPANGISATEAHVRVAVGLDYLGAAPVRGARYGGGSETLTVAVHVEQAAWQMQN